MGSFANTFVTVIHVLLSVFMIFVILLQPGKDAGMGAAFGGGAATSAFGGRGAVTFLSKLTAACAVLFFITSLGLSFAGLHRSVVSSGALPVPVTADAGMAVPGLPNGMEAPSAGAKDDSKSAVPGAGATTPPSDKTPEPPK